MGNTRSRSAVAQPPRAVAQPPRALSPALFEALLMGDADKAHALLRSTGGSQLLHKGPAGFSPLHAAVVSGCTAVLPALVAAGAPLDWLLKATYREPQQLELCGDFELRKFIQTYTSAASSDESALRALSWGRSLLAVAAWCVHLCWPLMWVPHVDGLPSVHAVRS
jgi:hypothetical protein